MGSRENEIADIQHVVDVIMTHAYSITCVGCPLYIQSQISEACDEQLLLETKDEGRTCNRGDKWVVMNFVLAISYYGKH